MTKALRFLAALLVALPAFAQAQQMHSQAGLDQMLAPIALYPDPLLSQVLMAATYPDEVRQAADWSRTNPGLQGDDAVRAVEYRNWDPSVKSLAAFPQLLARMDGNPAWTQSLGDAFLAQEPQVMDTVQQLRRRAQAAGNLQSSEQMYVQQQGRAILIQPASPQYVYVPYYDPFVVYGPWWWPAYRPVAWAPWPGYARPYRPGASVEVWWGAPVGLSFNFFFGNFDWRHRQVRVAHPAAYYYRPRFAADRAVAATPFRWQHESGRREAFAERVERRDGRQATRVQAQPVATVRTQPAVTVQSQPAVRAWAQPQPQPTVQQRTERREERREDRQAARAQATPLAQTPQVQPQARMPPAVAPRQPRAERQERQELRREPRNEHGPKGRERS